jgi:hypothetical protein
LNQALGLVLQGMRDTMGGLSSSEVAARLGLAASHYRMIEAGSAILQPARAIRVVQTFGTIEFVPLCQVLVAIQVLDSAKGSAEEFKSTAGILCEVNPMMSSMLARLCSLAAAMDGEYSEVAQQINRSGLREQLEDFLTTKPVTLTRGQIDNFMSPTYEHPLSGRLYDKIGNILHGVAPFYLDTVLQLIDNLKGVTPRVTAQELARWESLHNNRLTCCIGIIRDPRILLDIGTFDYDYLWEDNFKKLVVVYRDDTLRPESVKTRIRDNLKEKYLAEQARFEQRMGNFDEVVNSKLIIRRGEGKAERIDEVLLYGNVPMNNLWAYILANGYVVPFIDNATVDSDAADLYGTSLGYDETSEKLMKIRKLCGDLGLELQ